MTGKNTCMAATGLERARQALRGGDPAALLGERETVWLDVKGGVYRLDQPAGPEELAKDVAAFANTPDGGLLVVGFSTKKEHGEEILSALNPVPRTLVDLDKHRQIIATRVIPALRNVSVDWIDLGNESGMLIIEIPAQPRSSQLFAVPAPTGTTEVSKTAVGIPVRRGDGTTWLRPHEIQHFIGLGWANSGDGIDKLAAALATVRTPQPIDKPGHTVGGGEPGWGGVFQQAFNDLAGQGLWLGIPVTDVYRVGPGVSQHFETPTELFGWALCAQASQRPVAVAGEIWQALRDEGSGSPDGDALGALGFPTGDPTSTRVVDRHTTTVPLSGGRWGRGRLHRDADGQGQSWWWEPEPTPHTTMSAPTRSWSPLRRPQLQARVLSTLSWGDTSDLRITPDRIDSIVPELPVSPLAGFTTSLSRRRGGDLPAAVWNPGPNANASDRLSYSSQIITPDGECVLAAEVMMSLPPAGIGSAVVTCAEVRIGDFGAWARAIGADPTADLRWSVKDLFEFFVAAWETATDFVPRFAVECPTKRRRWSAVPHVELCIGTNYRHSEPESPPPLNDVLDMTPFGPGGYHNQTELFVSLPSVPGLDADTRRGRARSALVDMAHRYGFIQVRESSF
ncbi:helix-turn-helix domain-containing protein [Kutzneria sp. 744]|uniref:AlbA family DNA-binding domain-containing protein n=1 Tax=Kutzneria sp. (strain 744) TaxID=345341 RepID=UPI0012FA9323|nr:hypothetical protein [Kutzneria sp. 744]